MATQPTDLGIDLEAQPVFLELSGALSFSCYLLGLKVLIVCEEEVGGSATQQSPSCQSPANRDTTSASPASTSQEADSGAQPAASQEEGATSIFSLYTPSRNVLYQRINKQGAGEARSTR